MVEAILALAGPQTRGAGPDMTADSVVRESVAVADPDEPDNVIRPNSDGSINISGSISATSAADATAAAPTYSEGVSEPLSQNLAGDLRTIAKQSGTWTVALSAGSAVVGHVITDTGSTTAVTQATAASLNATVVGTGTFAVQATLQAGSAVAGKFGIDQTTPGTTNLVAAGQNGTWTVQPGNTANSTPWLVTAGIGKTIKTAPISAITSDTDVIAAVTSKRIKVIAYALFTTGTSASTLAFKSNGTGGTLLANVMLQSQASAIFGANLAIPAPSFLFATAAGEKLTLDVGNTDPITGFLTYFDDDAT